MRLKCIMEKIDLVYCWCDGNEPAFMDRKNHYLSLEKRDMDMDCIGELRFWDNNELLYSLRSIEKNLPWIHHIYIVTDRQVPSWLNTDNPKITVVDHKDIMPRELIPTFAATTIERYIVNIEGLAEKFLYSNDDLFINKPLTPEFFFSGDRPKVYLKYFERFHTISDMADFEKKYTHVATWMQTNLNGWKLLYDQYGRHEFYVTAHTVDAYTKTLYREVLHKYAEAFAQADKERFRSARCISRSIFGLDIYYSGQGDAEILGQPGFWEKHIHHDKHKEWKIYCGSENEKTRQYILKLEPDIFCVNADIKCDLQDKKDMQAFYQQLFPIPSQFEMP